MLIIWRFAEPRKVIISECRGSRILLLGKVLEVSVENSNHSIILAEVQRGIEIVNSEALTIVAGGTSVPIVKVQDSREISVIGHLDAIKEPLETHGSTGVTLFAVQDLSPNSGPEYVARQSFFMVLLSIYPVFCATGNSTTGGRTRSESMSWMESDSCRWVLLWFLSLSRYSRNRADAFHGRQRSPVGWHRYQHLVRKAGEEAMKAHRCAELF